MPEIKETQNLHQLLLLCEINVTRKQTDLIMRAYEANKQKGNKTTIDDIAKMINDNQKSFPNDKK